MTDSIVCSGCREGKPEDAYAVDRSRKTGRQRTCRSCMSAYFKRDDVRAKASRRERDRMGWAQRILRTYGLTVDDYNRMLDEQGGCCALCGCDTPDRGVFFVDHCHETGRVRGLLCSRCNLNLGVVEGWFLPRSDRVSAYLS